MQFHHLNGPFAGPFAANGHMVQNPPCWRASNALGHAKQRKFKLNSDEVALFWMSQCVAYSPAWRILYHVTVSCKEPIDWATNFLMRCSFTRHKRHVISMKSITLTSSTRTTRTSRIFNFSTRTSEEYWTCLKKKVEFFCRWNHRL